MKNKREIKEYVWTCDFCGEEFKTKKESDEHELTCKKNRNREILLRIKLPDKKIIFVLFFIFLGIYLFTFAIANSYAQSSGLPTRDLLQPQNWFSSELEKVTTPIPTPTLEITPTSTPTNKPKPTIKPYTATHDGTKTGKLITGYNSYCQKKQITVYENELISYTRKDGSQIWSTKEDIQCYENDYNQIVNKANQNNTTVPTNSGEIKINCSYHSGDYNFDYGMLTYNECKIKSDAYWSGRKAAIPTSISYPTTTPTSVPVKSQADIDKCKSEVREKYTNLINGCYIQYQGSASDACARGYQNLSSSEMSACY